ncbi:hypothetical protein [Mesorhizobium sp. 10J20-29]
MARWVKLTTATGDEKRPIYVNLDTVTYLFPADPGTRIWFAGHDTANVVVVEAPEEVVGMRTL